MKLMRLWFAYVIGLNQHNLPVWLGVNETGAMVIALVLYALVMVWALVDRREA